MFIWENQNKLVNLIELTYFIVITYNNGQLYRLVIVVA